MEGNAECWGMEGQVSDPWWEIKRAQGAKLWGCHLWCLSPELGTTQSSWPDWQGLALDHLGSVVCGSVQVRIPGVLGTRAHQEGSSSLLPWLPWVPIPPPCFPLVLLSLGQPGLSPS